MDRLKLVAEHIVSSTSLEIGKSSPPLPIGRVEKEKKRYTDSPSPEHKKKIGAQQRSPERSLQRLVVTIRKGG